MFSIRYVTRSPIGGAETAAVGCCCRAEDGITAAASIGPVWPKVCSLARMPIEASGFARSGQGALPRPKLAAANVSGLVGAAAEELIGAKLTRTRTFSKYLDAVNFSGGNPMADPHQVIDREIWFVDRKSAENKLVVEFELAAAFDLAGVMLPRRQFVQNVCPWRYRGAECGYTGGPVADEKDQPTSDPAKDRCGKRLASCKLRFGQYAELPFGGFPAVGLLR